MIDIVAQDGEDVLGNKGLAITREMLNAQNDEQDVVAVRGENVQNCTDHGYQSASCNGGASAASVRHR